MWRLPVTSMTNPRTGVRRNESERRMKTVTDEAQEDATGCWILHAPIVSCRVPRSWRTPEECYCGAFAHREFGGIHEQQSCTRRSGNIPRRSQPASPSVRYTQSNTEGFDSRCRAIRARGLATKQSPTLSPRMYGAPIRLTSVLKPIYNKDTTLSTSFGYSVSIVKSRGEGVLSYRW